MKYKYNGTVYDSTDELLLAIVADTGQPCGWPMSDAQMASWGVEPVDDSLRAMPIRKQKQLLKTQLSEAFEAWRGDTATFYSSLGFEADADSRAMQDITGLWTLAAENPDFKTVFMDARNAPHELNQQQLKTLRNEMIQSATDAYNQKWKARAAIEAAESYDDLMRVDIYFRPSDFRFTE